MPASETLRMAATGIPFPEGVEKAGPGAPPGGHEWHIRKRKPF